MSSGVLQVEGSGDGITKDHISTSGKLESPYLRSSVEPSGRKIMRGSRWDATEKKSWIS